MNNNPPRLFSNKFIQNLNTSDLPSSKKEEFRRFHEQKINNEKRQQILDRAKQQTINPPKFGSGTSTASGVNSDIYSELSKFQSSQQIPLSSLGITRVSPEDQSQSQIQIEKKTIVSIDSKDRDVNKYPEQNDFYAFLGKTFFNVKAIELVSTEFPNTDQVITDKPIQLQNNLIAWQNSEDVDLNFFSSLTINTIVPDFVDITLDNHGYDIGSLINVNVFNSKLDTDASPTGIIDGQRQLTVIDTNTFRFQYLGGISQGTASIDFGYPKYIVQIKPGNYTATTLATQISSDLGLIKRRNGSGQFHYFQVSISLDTDIMILDSVITTQLPNNSLSTIAGSTTITVTQNGHGFKTGDRVKMIGVKNLAGITANTLNGDFSANVLDFNTFTYEVITRASDTTQGGGNTIQTGKNAPFRLLFDTEHTRIQFNTGFPNENSSESIWNNIPANTVGIDPITTKCLSISDVTIISNTQLRFTTTENNHGLSACSVLNITNISAGSPPVITTATPHLISLPRRVTIRNTNCYPPISGTFYGIPTGNNTFILQSLYVTTAGNSGQVLYGTDKIKIFNLQTVPSILIDPVFFVENVPTPNQFDITFRTTSVDTTSIPGAIIGTSQIFVNHPGHSFNQISSITDAGNGFANIQTYLPNTLTGSRTVSVQVVDGPATTNTVDLQLANHGINTSDKIIVRNSTSSPIIDGTYIVQVVDLNTLRINFVHANANFIGGTCTVSTGNIVTISNTNSLPRVDGTYSVNNRQIITGISLGTITSTITVSSPVSWSVGDIITITNTDSTPAIDGEYTIQSVIDQQNFNIVLTSQVVSPGSTGIVINNNRFSINIGYTLTSPGVSGLLGRSNNVIHYRIQSDVKGSDNIANIPLTILNGIERPIDRLVDVDNYMVRVIEEYANQNLTSGGSSVVVSSQLHGFRSIQANTVTGTSDGKLYRSVSLEGQNYVFLISQSDNVRLDSVYNTSNIPDTFAKILLSESPGNMMFNSFISEPKVFDNPIAKIDQMRFTIVTSKGYPFNFNDIDYSLTLRITELTNQIGEAFVSSRTGTVEQRPQGGTAPQVKNKFRVDNVNSGKIVN